MSGSTSYHAGQAAEDAVAAHYEGQGCTVTDRRWRGKGGEIDIVAREGEVVVFVEVKRSGSHARAAERLGPRQIARLMDAAGEYLETQPKGALTEMRFDVALVDRDGRVEVLRNPLI